MWGLGAEISDEQGRKKAQCGKLPVIYKKKKLPLCAYTGVCVKGMCVCVQEKDGVIIQEV